MPRGNAFTRHSERSLAKPGYPGDHRHILGLCQIVDYIMGLLRESHKLVYSKGKALTKTSLSQKCKLIVILISATDKWKPRGSMIKGPHLGSTTSKNPYVSLREHQDNYSFKHNAEESTKTCRRQGLKTVCGFLFRAG